VLFKKRYYSVFTLGMLVVFESTVVQQRLRNLREMRSLTAPKQRLMVRCCCVVVVVVGVVTSVLGYSNLAPF
jgi:hypothetical protein